MRNILATLAVVSLILSPANSYAQEAAPVTAAGCPTSDKPVQVLQKGVVNVNLAEPSGVNWSTGKGRKDAILEWAVEDNYLQKTPGMFLRGFSNLAFGWVEILTHPVRWSKNAPAGIGTMMGLIMGPTMAVARTGSGALDVVTCWVPFWHGVPMSKPALGLQDVHHYGIIKDVDAYNHQTRRYGFNELSDEY